MRPWQLADSDERLVVRMVSGDRDALGVLYDRHAPSVFAVASRVLGDPAVAEDLLIDVFCQAFRSAADYDPKLGSVRTWLVLRARGRAVERQRASLVTTHVASEAPSKDSTPVVFASLGLEERERLVLELAYFEARTVEEIAQRLAATTDSVRQALAAAIGRARGSRAGEGSGQ